METGIRELKNNRSRYIRLTEAGVITPPTETGDPLENCPEIRLPPGTAAEMIDIDRGEA